MVISTLLQGHLDLYEDLRITRPRSGPVRRVVALTRGANPTFDYYILPRLDLTTDIVVDIDRTAPGDVGWQEGDYVLCCRYLTGRWQREMRARKKLAGFGVFLDDDFVAFTGDGSIPLAYRADIARVGLAALRRVQPSLTEVFVSTEELAKRFRNAEARIIGPIPDASDLATVPVTRDRPRIAFHAQLSHLGDHRFCAEIMRRLAAALPEAEIDVIGPRRARGLWKDLPNATFRSEFDWPAYRRITASEGADILVVPLLDTPLNRARAPTKAIDAVRMGAAAIFADFEPYAGLSGHARLVEADAEAWVEAIVALARAPDARLEAAARLRAEVERWRAAPAIPRLPG